MWRLLKEENGVEYYVKTSFENGCQVIVTDLCNSWKEEVERIRLLNKLKTFSPSMDIKEEALLSLLAEVLLEPSYISLCVEQVLKIECEKPIGMFKFKWTFELSPIPGKESSLMLRKEFFKPLISIVNKHVYGKESTALCPDALVELENVKQSQMETIVIDVLEEQKVKVPQISVDEELLRRQELESRLNEGTKPKKVKRKLI
jgi:hypothetical protein